MTTVEELIGDELSAAIGERVLAIRPIPEGHSGFTYWVDLDGRRAVLRLPPPGARIAGPADIPRQGRIMAALHGQGLPVPAVLAMSSAPAIDGRPYVLTEALAGERIEVLAAEGVEQLDVAPWAIDVLHSLQKVPIEKSGIEAESPVSLKEELVRWGWLMQRTPQELTSAAPALAEQLERSLPPEKEPVIVHGDYHFGNMLFQRERGRVSAVLDWEIAELGQPLLDLCCMCVIFHGGVTGDPGWGEEGLPADAVRDMFGADPDEFRWALALTYYKYAAILGYNLMLHRRGKRPDPSYESRTTTISGFIDAGLRLLV